MKKFKHFSFLSLLLCLFISTSVNSQSKLKRNHKAEPQIDIKYVHPDAPQMGEPGEASNISQRYASARGVVDKQVYIGETYYPLQTNNSTQNRLSLSPDGTLNAVWTMSLETTAAHTDRGTGYNRFATDAVEAEFPVARLESMRGGFPGITTIPAGFTAVISHVTDTNPYSLSIMTKNDGATEWTETNAPFGTPTGLLWPRSTTGGENGNSVHAIAITTPVTFATNGGAIYEGMDGKLLYYRSTNGGQTWGISDAELPGLDSLSYGQISADSYAITARGDVVVVALFAEWGDAAIWKSLDNGDTWTKTIMSDFPIDGYLADDGYTFEDTGMEYDSLFYPDSLAIFTCDASGAVILDNNDMAHVAYGEMFVIDNTFGDANTQFYPGTSGMKYWNESMGEDGAVTLDIVDEALDANNNDTLDIVDFGSYGTSLTSFPTLTIGEDNTLYLVWASIMEDFLDPDDNQNIRHLLISKTSDAGITWAEPFDLINEDLLLFPELLPTIECVYPSAYPHLINDQIHLIYQQDDRPGHSVSGDLDPIEPNQIIYIKVDKDFDLPPVGTEEVVAAEVFKLELSPNPASKEVFLNYTLEKGSDVNISMFNIAGQKIIEKSLKAQSIGDYRERLDISDLTSGTYIIRFNVDDQVTSQKLIVE